jgi:chromosome segregation ATPase
MAKLVGVCVILFMLAVGCLIVTAGPDIAALFAALRAEPLLEKLAWAVLVLVPLVMLPAAAWLSDSLIRQRKAASALEARLDGVRGDVRQLAGSQAEAEAAVHHLARTDPEIALGALQHRLAEAEGIAQVQQSRNEIGDLQSRVDVIRAQQQDLKQRLAPVLEKRHLIERLFNELATTQGDVERSLAEIASGDDAVALELRLKNLTEFLRSSHERCDQIDQAANTAAGLKEGFADFHKRLTPFAAAKDGITRRVKDLGAARDKLAAEIDALQRTPEGPLSERVQSFVDDKVQLETGVNQLGAQFAKLGTLRRDLETLYGKFKAALDVLSIDADGKANLEGRVKELMAFVDTTEDRLDNIEDIAGAFEQLRGKLGELQSRLVPLEAADSGVITLVNQVQALRDRLTAQVGRLETGDHGELAARVKMFAEAQRELEQRAAAVTEHFSKLATVRKDLAGLFEKLNSAAASST